MRGWRESAANGRQCSASDVWYPLGAGSVTKRQMQKLHEKQLVLSVPLGSDNCSRTPGKGMQMSEPELAGRGPLRLLRQRELQEDRPLQELIEIIV